MNVMVSGTRPSIPVMASGPVVPGMRSPIMPSHSIHIAMRPKKIRITGSATGPLESRSARLMIPMRKNSSRFAESLSDSQMLHPSGLATPGMASPTLSVVQWAADEPGQCSGSPSVMVAEAILDLTLVQYELSGDVAACPTNQVGRSKVVGHLGATMHSCCSGTRSARLSAPSMSPRHQTPAAGGLA